MSPALIWAASTIRRAWHALGVVTEVALKTLPTLPERMTLAIRNIPVDEAVALFSALATPFEVSGAAYRNGTAWLRIEGLGAPQLTIAATGYWP